MRWCKILIIWATIDAACFYGLGFSLSNMVFARYGATHDVIYGTVSLIINNGRMIRSAGFNYDPAHLGFLIPFVMGYGFMKKNTYICFLEDWGLLQVLLQLLLYVQSYQSLCV